MTDQELIEIKEDEYHKLFKDAHMLRCLKAAGVDNWDGYEDAYEMFRESYPEGY